MTHAQPQTKRLWNMNVDLMHGSILKSLLLFMLPILVSNLFQQLYNTVDTMIVGNVLGDTALAAIGSCGSIYELLVGFGIGIGNGLAIVAARSYGAQDEDLLKRTVTGSIVIGLIASLVITAAGFLGLRPLLQLLDTPAEILEEAYSYIIVIDLGVIVMFLYNLCAGLLRAIGNSVMPLVFLLISSALNVGPRTPTLMVSPEAAASAPVEAAVEAAVLLEEPPQAVRTPAAATTPAAARKLRREIIFFIVNFLLGNIRDSIIKTEARPLPSKRPCFVINIIDPPPQMRNSQTVHTFGFRLWTLLTK